MKRLIITVLVILMALSISGCNANTADESETDETLAAEETEEKTVEKVTEKVTYKTNLTVDKAESVNVKTDPNGIPYETSVEVDLKNPLDNESIKDKTNLKDIVNTEGDETYKSDENYIYWTNSGEDIHYKGYSDEKLPVSVNITYYLDGNKIEPSELLHKSGHVKIRFDYVNNTNVTSKVNGVNYNVKIPFVCLTMLYLSNDIFYNITAEDSEVMGMDDSTMIIGMGFPGLSNSLRLNKTDFTKNVDLKEYFEIEADVTDFELDYTATIVSNGLLEDVEDKDFKDINDMLSDVDDIDDQKSDIEDSKDELDEAKDEFSSLVDKLSGYVGTLNGKVTTMNSYSAEPFKALADKMTELNKILDTTKGDEYVYSFNTETNEAQFNAAKAEEIKYYTEIKDDATKDENVIKAATSALEIANYYYSWRELSGYSIGFAQSFDTSVKSSINEAFDDLIDVLDEFEDNIDDLTENIDSGLRETINCIKASRNVDKAYDNFSGIVDGKEGSVVFIYQSDEIK